ncbi:bifunctional 2-polyprenyl-6-hydroxyphenol methylase/3-demethylubiquinol 3-O-methyltransferase UbiG [Alteromonas gilva]|uniref:Ubiquinone biosynthesis O-methyltransferase n=1 Tax=Alteromonas gilva TaxID=2987522 RepID=A0ABT5L287_9ALTE|nr:bifunctional 2-polyprenyl-6-hydroxyphenol methylase/3-demethylubiquinol 3-O-methyltransferase UbiG [Alteromonas gilva]MDC8831153.1 bifunctional 2-polyprenyl-6-hydroxyphenol methylase/3-demethylubiquinol 3-O-methyltransferase UbiG [Alteromonas gilva]
MSDLNSDLNNNVDHTEIDKFSQIAAHWWDPEGQFKPLHAINPLRLSYIEEHSQGLFDKKVLDVGCGGGILAEALAGRGARVTGIDMADASLEIARLHSLESGVSVDYRCVSAEQLATEQAGQYDVVTCMEMLEHVPDPESIIRSCAQLVKPGGKVFFSTLNRNVKSYLMGIVAAEYLLQWVPKGTHQYQRFIKPSELIRSADRADLVTRSATGLHFDPFNQQFVLSQRNLDVNYILHCEKL